MFDWFNFDSFISGVFGFFVCITIVALLAFVVGIGYQVGHDEGFKQGAVSCATAK